MFRLSRHVVATLAAVVALGVAGGVGWYVFGQSEPTPWNKPAAEIDGAVVRLTYAGSGCRDGVDADVDESTTRVVITLREVVRATSCSDVAVPHDVEVRLDAPLAERELVDGACQMTEYAGYLECASDEATVERD